MGDLIFLSTENLSLLKGRAHKLTPKYLGPYKVLKADHLSLTYKIELPPDLKARWIHDTFHEKVLKPHIKNDPKLFPKCKTCVHYNVGNEPDQEWVVSSIEDHKWSPMLMFKVRWELGDLTWEPLDVVEDLEALDDYLELEGIQEPADLQRK